MVLTSPQQALTTRSCWDCEASCGFSASLLSIKTSNNKQDLTALWRSQAVVVPVIFICRRSLCISLPLCVAVLIFSHPACPSSSVYSWWFDSVTAVENVFSFVGVGWWWWWGGGVSAGVRCLSRHHWLLCVWVCFHACVNKYLRCVYIEYALVHSTLLCASSHCHPTFL